MSVEIIHLDDEQLDSLFGESAPDKTFKAEDLSTAQKKEEEKTSKKPPTKDEKPVLGDEEETPPNPNITEEDEDVLFKEEDEEDGDKKSKPKTTKEEKQKEVKTVNFKNVVDHLIESGKWVDFEGREDLEEFSEEEFYALSEKQDEYRANKKFNDILDSTGEYGKAIVEFEKNGGNPSELLNLFREQRDILNISLDSEENQEEVIRAYLELQGEDDSDINDFIETAKDKGADYFKTLAEKRHAKLLETNKQEIQAIQEQQKNYKKQQEDAQLMFQSNIKKAIHSTADWSNSEKKDLEKFLLSYDKKLQDGRTVNGLFVKMLEIQQDPSKYIKFAKFIQDMEKYEQTVAKKAEKETVKKNWKLLKESEADVSKKGSILPDSSSTKRIDPFSITFKN